MMKNYLIYLDFITKKLTGFFEKQKPYIFCAKGCAKCCKHAQFPYSQIEAVYLLEGAKNLSDEKLALVMENIEKIKQEKKNFKGEKFLYDCPFLIDDACCVYEYRGVICRSFGLISIGEDGKNKAPFCCFEGYNYSNVLDETGKISAEKFEKSGIKTEPAAFNTSYKFLTDEKFEKAFNFKFGEKKSLIEWLIKE